MLYFTLIIIAYLIGSIPFGVMVSKLYSDKDITKEGSCNVGATNVARVAGSRAGIITLACDVLKGAFPVLFVMAFTRSPFWISVVAIAVFTGHLYPLFNYLKGGKGVATALGLFLSINPVAALCGLAFFAVIVKTTGYVSLGSISAAAIMPVMMGLFSVSRIYVVLSLIIGVLVIYKHKDNISRLMNGTENRRR